MAKTPELPELGHDGDEKAQLHHPNAKTCSDLRNTGAHEQRHGSSRRIGDHGWGQRRACNQSSTGQGTSGKIRNGYNL